ncbi:sugar phosphate isomerase/epimerase [Oscillospiraceae bacterium HV4-5-C5C]|nr:sugar phosphate isomerase/epimerase [Oscillospiraceae bacterium HV4-5-C5C]
MILGAQLYTLRSFTQTAADLDLSMERVAAMGYTTVQISAIGDIPPQQVRDICDRHGLKIVLTHTNPDRILNETEQVIAEHEILGCDYIGIGMMPERYRYAGWLDRFAKDYREAAKKIAAAGKLLMYHNHHLEFAKLNGERIILQLLDAFKADELGFTLDTYWVQAAGGDVCSWIKTLAGRIPCIHLKDMDVLIRPEGVSAVMAPVLEGNMNFQAILPALEQAGTRYALVEQDVCQEDPFVCLQKSYDNLAELGYK